MQAASEQTTTTNQWLTTAVTSLIIIIAIILFGAVISRMGLLNRLGSGETAVAPSSLALTAEAMRFGQNEWRVKAGQQVTVVLENFDLYEHSLDIDELGLHVVMPPNGRTEITFIPTESGTYTIYCAVPGHRDAGMVSILVVGE